MMTNNLQGELSIMNNLGVKPYKFNGSHRSYDLLAKVITPMAAIFKEK